MNTLNQIVASAFVGVALCSTIASAQPASKELPTEETDQADMKKDHIMMKDGKMMMMKDGSMSMMDKDMTLTDGTKVMKNGNVMTKDGNSMMMADGDMIMMDGKIMKAKKIESGPPSKN